MKYSKGCKSMVGFFFNMQGKKNFIMKKRYRKVQKLGYPLVLN